MPERGYVVVRPDGTVMWETARETEQQAWRAAGDEQYALVEQLVKWGFRLMRLRVEEE